MTGEYPLFCRHNIDVNFLHCWNFDENKLRLCVGVVQQQWWTILLKRLMIVFCIQLGPRNMSVIRSSRISAIQGLLKY